MRIVPTNLVRALASAVTSLLICGQPLAASADDYEPVLVISMGDHFFEVPGLERGTPIKVRAGRVYFIQLRNNGKQEHNVAWGRDVLTKDGVPWGYVTSLFGHVPVTITHRLLDMKVDGLREMNLKAGQEVELELTIPEGVRGEWELGCFIPGHYHEGMTVPFIVE